MAGRTSHELVVYRNDNGRAACPDRLHDLDREEPRMTTFNFTISDHMIVLGGVIAALAVACFLLWLLPR
jgi:hypothetical protein